jgi:hypothetical protein
MVWLTPRKVENNDKKEYGKKNKNKNENELLSRKRTTAIFIVIISNNSKTAVHKQ